MVEWGRIRAVFERVVDLPAAERGRRLDELCAGEPDLRSRVEELLAADGTDSTPAIEASPPVDLIAPDPARIRRIGAYRIVRLLGSGGMGMVFEARQDRPDRRVALKVLRTLVGSAQARRRLEYEAEALGRLHHPNVAGILEAGTWRDPDTGEEAPFFAMEFVEEARPLDDYANANRLGLEDRLQLFLQVCDAVHHGHQQGVLHRDLKPQNILVGRDRRPLVIDFGIARATDAAGGPPVRTLDGQVLGTLGYMSPEQIDGDPQRIDVRADVYSLGATLYELLTGRPPHERGDESLAGFLARVRTETPRRPSSIRDAPVPVPPELDWVVLRALAAVPEERYASVSELAGDLRRFLADEPLAARPPTRGYLLAKFVRRHRAGVAAGVAIFLVLVAGIVASATGWRRAIAAERQAESRRIAAENALDELLELGRLQGAMLRGARGDPEIKLRDVLQLASDGLEQNAALNEPIAGGLHTALAVSFQSIGDFEQARHHLERALALVGDRPGRRRQFLEIRANYASLMFELGRLQEAEAIRRENLAEFVAMYGEGHRQVAAARSGLAVVLAERGDHAAAAELYRKAIACYRRQEGPDSASLVAPLTGLATSLHRSGRDDEAAPLFDRAMELSLRRYGREDQNTLTAMQHRAMFLLDSDRLEEAREQLQELLAIQKGKYGPSHVATTRTLTNLGLCYEREERYGDAEAVYRQVLAAREAAGRGHGSADLITRFNLAVALHRQQAPAKLAEALGEIEVVIADAQKSLPADNWRLAVFRQHRGIILRKSGRFAEAEADLAAARTVLEQRLGTGHSRTRSNYEETAELYRAWGKPEEARRWRQKLGGR